MIKNPSVRSISVIRRNNVSVSGNGTHPVLFAHGFGCDQTMWRFILPEFQQRYRTIAFDYVGAGHSDISAYDRRRYATLQGYPSDILDICEALDIYDCTFVGHSVSCMSGILASIRQPERFNRLVLVAPSPCYINDAGYTGGFERSDIENLLELLETNHMGWSASMAPIIMGNPDQPHLSQELTESFCRTDPEIAQQFARVTFLSDFRSDLPRVRHPALILQCREDAIAPECVGQYMHRHMPNSTLALMNATGHCPHLSAPTETAALISRFF